MLLTKQKNPPLINYAQSRDEANVINAIYHYAPIYVSINTLTQLNINESKKLMQSLMNEVIEVLAKWRIMIGVSFDNHDEKQDAEELKIIAKFIINNYDNITIQELKQCINLSIIGVLNVDTRHYNNFSCLYVSNIIIAYLEYKRNLVNELNERREKHERELYIEDKPTAEVKMKGITELLQYLYDEYKSNGIINDYFNAAYSFLRRTKRLKHNQAMIDEATKYGKEKCRDEVKKIFGIIVNTKEKPNIKAIEDRFAKNYFVQKLFDKINIDELISSIKISEFTE